MKRWGHVLPNEIAPDSVGVGNISCLNIRQKLNHVSTVKFDETDVAPQAMSEKLPYSVKPALGVNILTIRS